MEAEERSPPAALAAFEKSPTAAVRAGEGSGYPSSPSSSPSSAYGLELILPPGFEFEFEFGFKFALAPALELAPAGGGAPNSSAAFPPDEARCSAAAG